MDINIEEDKGISIISSFKKKFISFLNTNVKISTAILIFVIINILNTLLSSNKTVDMDVQIHDVLFEKIVDTVLETITDKQILESIIEDMILSYNEK